MIASDIALLITAVGIAAPGLVAAVLSIVNFFALRDQAEKIEAQHKATNSRLDELVASKVETATLTERAEGEARAKVKDNE